MAIELYNDEEAKMVEYRSECEKAGKQVRQTFIVHSYVLYPYLYIAGSTCTTPLAGCYGKNLSEWSHPS